MISREFVIQCDECDNDQFGPWKSVVVQQWRADGGTVSFRGPVTPKIHTLQSGPSQNTSVVTDLSYHDKYTVIRNDGTDRPGEKHDGCQYFVLDLTHDAAARDALKFYANRCADGGRMQLANSLDDVLAEIERGVSDG